MICSSENRDLRICHPLRVEDSANSWPEITGLGQEAQNALTKSIKQLVSFLEKGGHVDFIAPNPSEDESADEDGQSANSEIAEIRNLAEQVRQLENDIKLIETNLNGHSPDESQEQPPSS